MTIIKTEHFDIQRKIVANMTTESWQNIPHVGYIYEPEVSAMYREYKKVRAEYPGHSFTINTLVLKIIAEGLKAAPVLNSHISFDRRLVRGRVDTLEEINISMPMILPNGKMMTVNLRDFGNKNLDEMTEYISDVRRRAEKTDLTEAMYGVSFNDTITKLKHGRVLTCLLRILGAKTGKYRVKTLTGKAKKAYESIPPEDRLTVKDLEQGSVTVSNIGSLFPSQSGSVSLLEIVPPQVAAFGVGAVRDMPVVHTDEIGNKTVEAGKVLPICIAFDHRAMDFGDIVPFMKRLDEIFASPEIISSWLSEEKPKSRIIA